MESQQQLQNIYNAPHMVHGNLADWMHLQKLHVKKNNQYIYCKL